MEAAARLDKLEKEFFTEWGRRNPILGTSLGMHEDCDERLPDGTLSKLQDDVRFLKRYEAEFAQIDPHKLPPSHSVDRDFAIHQIRQWVFDREELRFWESVPEVPQVVGEAIFQLLSRNFPSLPIRLKSIMKRLEALPQYLEESKSKLRTPAKLFVENELETLTRLPGFFNFLKEIANENLSKTPQRNMHRLVEAAQNALERYSDWLIVDVLPECRETYAIGEAKFLKLLAVRGIKETPNQLVAFAEAEAARLRDKLKDLAREIKRKVPVDDVREMIKQQHPETFDSVMSFVRDQVNKTRQFVNRSKFAELPPGDALYVIKTPSYLRHIVPFGAYSPPARLETKREGYYFVTPGDCDSDKLKEHNYAALANMTVHEAYPGHHLHHASSAASSSLIRAFADDPFTTEGWAHYCEERMKEMGYDDTPPSRFMMTLDLLFRADRVVMDVRISTGKMGFQQGVEHLIDTMGMDRVAAEAEMRRYVVSPGHPLSYLLGKERIKDLKKWARERMKARFSETFFHTSVLRAGPIPIDLLRRDLEWRIEEELKKPPPKEPAHGEKGHKKNGKKGHAAPAHAKAKKK